MLYHVIASTSSIQYRLDRTITSNVLYFQHDDLFILLWQTQMKEKYLQDNRHTRWYEGNVAFLGLLFASSFFGLRLFGCYLASKDLDLLSSDFVIKQIQQVLKTFECHIVFCTFCSVYCQYDASVSVTEQLTKKAFPRRHSSCRRSCSKVLETVGSVSLNKQPMP